MSDQREWLIRKNGYFYRPNRQGYTMEKVAAGRYTRAEAEREAAIEPKSFTILHESEVPDAPQVIDLKAELEQARRVSKALLEENAKLRTDLADDIRRLADAEATLEETRRALKRDDKYHAGYIAGSEVAAACRKHAEAAEANAGALVEALEFYANGFVVRSRRVHGVSITVEEPTDTILDDCGEVARAAIARHNEQKISDNGE